MNQLAIVVFGLLKAKKPLCIKLGSQVDSGELQNVVASVHTPPYFDKSFILTTSEYAAYVIFSPVICFSVLIYFEIVSSLSKTTFHSGL